MDQSTIALIISIIILILFSAFFSASETAFSSLNRIRISNMASEGSKRAALVARLNENYDKLLSSILVGNNIVNITTASLSTILFVTHFGDIGVTLSTIVITTSVLVFGEITPKSLAKDSPEKFAMFAAPIMQVFITVFAPINLIFTLWKKGLSLFLKNKPEDVITEKELLTIIEEAEQDGTINEEDKQLIHNVIEFDDCKVQDIMTPRVDIIGVSKKAPISQITDCFIQTNYSRLPVYEETIDNIIGTIHIRDFFETRLKEQPIAEIIKPIVFTAPTTKISELLKTLQTQKSHIAVVTDEYGGTAGIITMEDILEELVGEIWDEHDEVVENITKLEDGSYKITCSTEIDDLLDHFGITAPSSESNTVGGWVMEQLGTIPKKGDSFTYQNLFVTVYKTIRRRAVEIIITDKRTVDN